MRINEELFEIESSCCGLENRHERSWEPPNSRRDTPLSAKVGGCSVGVVLLRTKNNGVFFLFVLFLIASSSILCRGKLHEFRVYQFEPIWGISCVCAWGGGDFVT
jgi:hypothetical protein